MIDHTLENRRKLWLALSELYLDTELTDEDYFRIANEIKDLGFVFGEAKRIDYYEVAPALGANLLSTAGIWSGFCPEEINTKCHYNYTRRENLFFRIKCHLYNTLWWKFRKENWKRLQKKSLNC
ncbi:DUF7079 family protein [Reichenbachiella sp.]